MTQQQIPASMPFSEEAERGLLHCMTLRSVLETYCGLSPAVFYIPAHQIVFGHMCEMLERNQLLDFSVILDRLKASNQVDEIGGKEGLSDIWGFPDTSGDHEYYSGVILDCYRRRVAILEIKELLPKLYDRRTDTGESIRETVERTLTALALSAEKKERTFRSDRK